MGIERSTVTAKVDLDNRLWLEGKRQNDFSWVTLSTLINLLFTWMRLSEAAQRIHVTPAGLQDLQRNHGQEDLRGIPGIPAPQKVQAMAKKAGAL